MVWKIVLKNGDAINVINVESGPTVTENIEPRKEI
jgi:hypothetical protein